MGAVSMAKFSLDAEPLWNGQDRTDMNSHHVDEAHREQG